MADIFISYAKKDGSRVEPLAKALEAREPSFLNSWGACSTKQQEIAAVVGGDADSWIGINPVVQAAEVTRRLDHAGHDLRHPDRFHSRNGCNGRGGHPGGARGARGPPDGV